MSGIVVVRALRGVGDMLCAVPALRSLRAGAPEATISLVGLQRAAWFVERFPEYVDELLEFPGWPGIDEQALRTRDVPSFLASVQRRRFDLAVQCHGGGTQTNGFVRLLGAAADAGFVLPGAWCPDPERYLEWDGYEPEPVRWSRLVVHLGFPDTSAALELPVRERDRDALAVSWPAVARAPYACLTPGATHPSRRWSVDGFAAVGDALARRGLTVVLTGTEEERPLTHAVAGSMAAPSVDLAGHVTLGALFALVAGAELVVTNDTGTSHVAAAVRTPSVVVFRASDPARWAPLDRTRHAVVGTTEPVVREHLGRSGAGRCLGEGCMRLVHDTMAVPPPRVTPADVLAAADQVLAGAVAAGMGGHREGNTRGGAATRRVGTSTVPDPPADRS